MSEQTHQADPQVLSRRTLEKDHRHLTGLLTSGMSVLDVGCGTGAITAGIAGIVGEEGRVVGVDRDPSLIDIARHEHGGSKNLVFKVAEVVALPFRRRFDLVTAARAVQWFDQPEIAIFRMSRAARHGGKLVVLDYNHERNTWDPAPPPEFQKFYTAFLAWRTANGWSNAAADRLSDLFRDAALTHVSVMESNEVVTRGDADFSDAALLWHRVVESLGAQLVASGYLTEEERIAAAESYKDFVTSGLDRQINEMKTVVGTTT